MTTHATTSLGRREYLSALDACGLDPAEPQMIASGNGQEPLGVG